MQTKTVRLVFTTLAMFLALTQVVSAESKLYVPRFQYGAQQDTQFLLVNTNEHESAVDLWAFTGSGELLGQFRLQMKAKSTRALTLGEAFAVRDDVSGWLAAVSSDDGIQLSYTLVGDGVRERDGASSDAIEWSTQEQQITIENPGKQVLRISNPNAFAAQVTLNGVDQAGRFVARRDISVAPFAQVDALLTGLTSEGGRLNLFSNAQIISKLDEAMRAARESSQSKIFDDEPVDDRLELVVDTEKGLGAYQVSLRFDPKTIQLSSKDISGGSAEGFDSKPLAVNIDNEAGEITIGSFQVGSAPRGRLAVARLDVKRRRTASSRFSIRLDSAADVTGASVATSDVTVGLVRVR